MQINQRGAKQKCNRTAENLLLDSVVLRDGQTAPEESLSSMDRREKSI